jgi:hypothetical protein
VTQPCDNCGTPTENPTCDRCLGYQAWASDSGNPRPESGRLHERRIRETRQHLGELPDLYALLPFFTLPGVGVPEEERSGGAGFGSRPPVNLDVIDLGRKRQKKDTDAVRTEDERARDREQWRWEIEDTRSGHAGVVVAGEPARFREGILPMLFQWTRLIDGEMWDEEIEHEGPAEDPTISGECGFLLAHFAWITEQPWWLEFYDEIKTMHRLLLDATHQRVEKARLTCLNDECGWDVFPVETEVGNRYFKCEGCGETWGALELHRMAERKRPRKLSECAKITGVSVRSLRTEIAEHALRPKIRDGNTDLFDLQDVAAVAARIKLGRTAGRTKTRAS